jgi:hypothetical protein
MADLAAAFFERDLSDAEWRELGKQVAREDAVADKFLASAQAYHASLGLPEPRPRGGRGSGGGGSGLGSLGSWLGALVLGAALGATVVHFWFPAEPQAPVPAKPIPAQPAGTAVPLSASPPRASLPQPTLAPPPLGALAPRVASEGFPGLSAVVHLASQGLVTARVLNEQGDEARVLYAGVLEAGSWSFGWDGRDEAGVALKPGRYTIEVQEGSHVLRKSVDLSAKGQP